MGRKFEIEGEIFCYLNSYDQYYVPEISIITNDMNRDNIIFKNKRKELAFPRETRDKLWPELSDLEDISNGKYIVDWLLENLKIEPARHETGKNNDFISFQPQTKKVKITVEEID